MAQHIDHSSFMMDEEISRCPALSPSSLPMLRGQVPVLKMGMSKDSWRSIFDSVACGLLVWNTTDRILEANRAAQQILGGKLAEMQQVLSGGAAGFARSDEISLAPAELLVSRLLSSGEAQYDVLEDFTGPDGAKRWLQLDVVPVYGEHEAIRQVVVTFQDVTERIQMETALHEREQLFRALTENPTTSRRLSMLPAYSGTSVHPIARSWDTRPRTCLACMLLLCFTLTICCRCRRPSQVV